MAGEARLVGEGDERGEGVEGDEWHVNRNTSYENASATFMF
jgi:hypothetical protein